MKITKTSLVTGKVHSMDLPITQEHIDQWQSGTLIQDAMPHLTADEREFLLTGTTPEEWNALLGQEE